MMVTSDQDAFLDWFPRLAAIGARSREPVQAAIRRGGFKATGEAKIIDNAIMGYMQQHRRGAADADRLSATAVGPLGRRDHMCSSTTAHAARRFSCEPNRRATKSVSICAPSPKSATRAWSMSLLA